MAIRISLVSEVVVMAFDTVRTNKLRSALTILGVVIGITSIVGMTAMIRGFDQSLRDMIRAVGPDTIFVQRFGITSFANGAEVKDLFKRPNLTVSDARAIEEITTSAKKVAWLIRSQSCRKASCVRRSKSFGSSSFRPCRIRMTRSTSAIAVA